MSFSFITPRRALLLALAPTVAMGQQADPAHRHVSAPASAPTTAAAAAKPKAPVAPYRSAFDGYRGFADAKPVPWREANDNVGRIGGWRAYAREAAQANPANSGTGADKGGHGAHGKP
jgi:hypothetical protein